MIQALIFDFDGTLFDTGPGILRSVQYALERFGIRETDLEKLRVKGFRLGVATGKPTQMAEQILKNHGMEHIFDCVYGSEPDGLRAKKEEAITAVLEMFGLTGDRKREALMIGDRKYDVAGAQKCGLACVGVYYGYAEPGELEQAGAAITVDTVEALGKYLWNLN